MARKYLLILHIHSSPIEFRRKELPMAPELEQDTLDCAGIGNFFRPRQLDELGYTVPPAQAAREAANRVGARGLGAVPAFRP